MGNGIDWLPSGASMQRLSVAVAEQVRHVDLVAVFPDNRVNMKAESFPCHPLKLRRHTGYGKDVQKVFVATNATGKPHLTAAGVTG